LLDAPRINSGNDFNQLGKRVNGEICPDAVVTKKAVVAVNAVNACGVSHFDVGGMIANHQDFRGLHLKPLHDGLKRHGVGLRLFEGIAACDEFKQ